MPANIFRKHSTLFILIIAYAAMITAVSCFHELARDEVVPLTMVKESKSLAEVAQKMHNYGHPVLFHSILYAGYQMYPKTPVLKIVNVLICIAAVWIFLAYSPFRLYQKGIFIFGYFPLYEYAAINRNYGLCMLLIFLVGALYPKRFERMIPFSLALALLSNTHALGTIIAIAVALSITAEMIFKPSDGPQKTTPLKMLTGLSIFALGIIIFLKQTVTDNASIIFRPSDVTLPKIAQAAFHAITSPGDIFHQAFALDSAILTTVVIVVLLALFIQRLDTFIIFAGSVIGMAMFSDLIYPLNYTLNHQGFLIMMMILCFWISSDTKGPVDLPQGSGQIWRRWLTKLNVIRTPLINLLLISQMAFGLMACAGDITGDFSSNAKLGDLLKQPQYQKAILVAEPDYVLESLPYYADNPVYIYRERRFGNYTQFTKENLLESSLSDLLASARRLQKENKQKVLIVIGLELPVDGPYTVDFGYQKLFTYSKESLQEFESNTDLIATFQSATTDENFKVFELR